MKAATGRRALVFAGGAFDSGVLSRIDAIDSYDLWCVDGGLHYAVEVGLTPQFIVGDCDSVSPNILEAAIAQGAKLSRHAPEKNASDLELTLLALVEAGYNEVMIVAVTGGRTDHTLFNWLLAMQCDWPFRLTMLDSSITAQLVHAEQPFVRQLTPHATVSLVSREQVSGVTTHGLVYALQNASLQAGHTLGLSNEVITSGDNVTEQVQVSVGSGRLLVCVVHECN